MTTIETTAPTVPSRVLKVMLPADTYRAFRHLAVDRDLPASAAARELIERELAGLRDESATGRHP